MKIVVIDDDLAVLAVIKTVLERAGHQVMPARSAVEGMDLVIAQCPDVVLTDVRMTSEYDGVGVVAILTQDERTAQIPVIAVTGFAQIGDGPRYRALGFAGVIPKPFNTSSFAAEVAQLVEEHGLIG